MRKIEVRGLSKDFTLHLQGGMQMQVLDSVDMDVEAGECVAVHAPSGAGKSTLLRCLYANYRASAGSIRIRHEDAWVDVAAADARKVHAVRRSTLGFVTQFLRVIPRVATLDLVAEPLIARGISAGDAQEEAKSWLSRLRVPPRLWQVPPATFSGGEQQRVNIARTLICDYPVLLLDEPTASLDEANRDTVIGMINAARERGVAIVGIFHDEYVRRAVATRLFPIAPAQPASLASVP
jgi:alpha-D-ribose 1-methylphosphonate 5-triphosphate synthase subunit PhnL